jgi:hypothetical protein
VATCKLVAGMAESQLRALAGLVLRPHQIHSWHGLAGSGGDAAAQGQQPTGANRGAEIDVQRLQMDEDRRGRRRWQTGSRFLSPRNNWSRLDPSQSRRDRGISSSRDRTEYEKREDRIHELESICRREFV